MNKFIFFGTPEVASETLKILKESGYLPCMIVTSPDSRQGRGMEIKESPASLFAKENNIPCLKPENLNKELLEELKKERAKLFIVVAYGKIFPEEFLNIPELGSINIHYSLLPKYRGASPVESAVLNGEKESGVTIQKMAYKMDAGPVIAFEKTNILPEETAPELKARLIKIGGNLLIKTLPDIFDRKSKDLPQNEAAATYCKKIKKEDGEINLAGDPLLNYNKFRAYAHWPRTFFFKDDKRIIITKAKLENGQFVIEKVLPEGKKETSWEDFRKIKN